MLFNALLLLHIAVVGYWLGSEFVINSTFRYVTWASSMSIADRERLMDHVMNVDQHVRYALVLQLGSGAALATMLGFLPGEGTSLVLALALTALWLGLVEVTHRRRKTASGRSLARIDRLIRYAIVFALLATCLAGLLQILPLPVWLSAKLGLFAGVIICGVGIRHALTRYFDTWRDVVAGGSNDANEARLRHGYFVATSILAALWVLIIAIVALSLLKVT